MEVKVDTSRFGFLLRRESQRSYRLEDYVWIDKETGQEAPRHVRQRCFRAALTSQIF